MERITFGMPDDLRHAGELLRDVHTTAATASLASRTADVDALAAFYARTPGDATAAVGATLLAMARLSAHVEHELGTPFLAAAKEYEKLPELDTRPALDLAAEVVAHAVHARELDPDDNLSAFAQGLAHELRGEPERAADAYRAAVRLDRYDHQAVARLETITGEDADQPEHDPRCTHAGAFYLLDLLAPEDADGRRERLVLLSTDAAAVRAEADAYFAARAHSHEILDYSVETHIPGEESESDFLLSALGTGPDGRAVIDWDEVEMPPLTGPLLPPGRAIRENSEWHVHGRHVFTEEAED